jgi:hypothetical protein
LDFFFGKREEKKKSQKNFHFFLKKIEVMLARFSRSVSLGRVRLLSSGANPLGSREKVIFFQRKNKF